MGNPALPFAKLTVEMLETARLFRVRAAHGRGAAFGSCEFRDKVEPYRLAVGPLAARAMAGHLCNRALAVGGDLDIITVSV
jgi:hypothetical protein